MGYKEKIVAGGFPETHIYITNPKVINKGTNQMNVLQTETVRTWTDSKMNGVLELA
jgi:hypothetical protein